MITNDPSTDGNEIITNPPTPPKTRFAQDAFSMMLGYFEGDFARTGSAFNSTGSRNGVSYTKNAHMLTNTHGLYNGNISSQVGSTLQSGGTYSLKGDVYRYDLLNRLRSNTDQVFANNVWSSTSNFANSYSYDANGNIKNLMRSKEDGVVFDELEYKYKANTNQLKQVTDSKGDAVAGYDIDNQSNASNYEYDKIGNMTKDNQEGLTITWLPSGKIESVTKVKTTPPENWQLRFKYDAAGRRVAKERFTKDNAGVYAVFGKGTYYVYEASGKVLATYEKENGITKLREVPLLGSSRLGMDRVDVVRSNTLLTATNVYSRTVGSKNYELTDHLGNVRAVVGDIKLPSGMNFTADLKSSSEYYPFGMALPARGYQSAEYRYGYNGKEKDDEVKGEGNSYDFGARIYDSRLGRFLTLDPLESKYPYMSSYCYAGNMPISHIDANGEGPEHIILEKIVTSGIKAYYKTKQRNQEYKEAFGEEKGFISQARTFVVSFLKADASESGSGLIGGSVDSWRQTFHARDINGQQVSTASRYLAGVFVVIDLSSFGEGTVVKNALRKEGQSLLARYGSRIFATTTVGKDLLEKGIHLKFSHLGQSAELGLGLSADGNKVVAKSIFSATESELPKMVKELDALVATPEGRNKLLSTIDNQIKAINGKIAEAADATTRAAYEARKTEMSKVRELISPTTTPNAGATIQATNQSSTNIKP